MTQQEKRIGEDFKNYLRKELKIEDFDCRCNKSRNSFYIYFPNEDLEGIEYEAENLQIYLNEISSLRFYNDYSKVTTDSITQKVIQISSNKNLNHLISLGVFCKETPEGFMIKIIDDPLLIGIGASVSENYDHYNPPCSSHLAIEIIYPDSNSRLSDLKEDELIKIFMFELSHAHNISFEFSTYKLKEYDLDDAKIDFMQASDFVYNIPLEDYNYGMELFINANQRLSSDLQFMSYYKIFEYFAPIQARIEAFQSMKLKLSSSKVYNHDANFISSIFDLARNYDHSIKDSELVKSLINSAFDLVDLYDELPKSIHKKLKQNELKYNSKAETKDKIINELGMALYQTRNSIVHAKSNYDSKGYEVDLNDLPQLNKFMHKACFSIIKWYVSLPKHLKINIDK